VHDTNVGVDVSFRYYVWQLGYALFPWTGLIPAGLVWWLRRREDAAGSGRGDASVFLIMWFVFAFALFTAMLTKFHHYIFPAVPPAAMLTGILLDRMMGERPLAREGGLWGYLVMLSTGTLLTIYGFFRLFPGTLMGFKPEDGDPRPGMPMLGVPLIIVGAAIIVLGIRRFGAKEHVPVAVEGPRGESKTYRHSPETPLVASTEGSVDVEARPHSTVQRERFEDMLLGAVGIAAAIVVGAVGYDLASNPSGAPGQANLLYLFTYNYKRAWPDSLDFSGMIAAFTLVAAVVMFLLVVRRFRHHVVMLSLMVGYAWALWALDIYMVKTAPHWGQRETTLAYYVDRKGPEEPIVAYQMNWKGENFYTSNRIPAFVSSGAKFKSWIQQERDRGVRVFYFVTEHGRARGLQNELGKGIKSFDKVTEPRLNNKFGLFKVVFDDTGRSDE